MERRLSSLRRSGAVSTIAAIGASCMLALCCMRALAMQPMSDAALSSVQARDGLSFDLSGFSMSGDARITYYAPGTSGASAYVGNIYLSRSDDTTNAFGDPYKLDVVRGATGMADIINLAFPINANGLARWQAAFDWGVNADGIAFDGGAVVVRDMVLSGGSHQWTTPRTGDGIAFGTAVRMDIGNLLLRPRGRDDITLADPVGVKEQLNISGIHIGAADSNGNLLNSAWRIADVTSQPGVINAVTDASGNSRFHIGIDWPDANGAPLGGMKIDNITFRSDVTGTLDLGSSRIGSMQIQYLDIKVRP